MQGKKVFLLLGIITAVGAWNIANGTQVKASSKSPVYRLYNPNSGEHFYTTNFYEGNSLKNVGWRDEGIGWQAANSGEPVYRLYNPNVKGGDHYYTLSKYEAQTLVNLGWRWDNNANPVFYSAGTVNLYVSYNPNAQSGAHNYTTNIFEQNSLLSVGWKYGAIAWKTMPSDSLPGTPAGWTIDRPMNIDNYSTQTYAYKQCTWWVYNRAKEFGINYGQYMGNGKDWQNQAGYQVTSTPQLHSAVSFKAGQDEADTTYGHVAFVEKIRSDGSILISQSGTGYSTLFSYQVLSKDQASRLRYVIGK